MQLPKNNKNIIMPHAPTAMLTIFTPTYNRAHTLPRLYESLKAQTCKDFEWLVVDDGSSDNTSVLLEEWQRADKNFIVRYLKVENGGKNRAINIGLKYARGQYFMILDSDDMLTADSVEFVCKKMPEVEADNAFIGISGKKADYRTGLPIGVEADLYSEEGFTDCNNLERIQFGLHRDMAEVFFTDKIRQYEFKVWQGEKFTPEEVVWNQMALDGYRLRWYNKITYLCEYQHGGLSDSTWSLLRDNPMGYAMMFDQRLLIDKSMRGLLDNSIQYNTCCILAGEIGMIAKSKRPWLTLTLFPAALLLSYRRKKQFKRKLVRR